jgi:hypothetical protein
MPGKHRWSFQKQMVMPPAVLKQSSEPVPTVQSGSCTNNCQP